jgi:lipopolysaccharide/colanic/teichoic acid biosynthesis glycosyltransferase
MSPDAEQRLDQVVVQNERAGGPLFKMANDPRRTRLGAVLEALSIDEVPQLWNVLRGEMSLVGPRPVTQAELDAKYGVLGEQAFAVRPGLTGLWQVNGRSSTTYAARVRYDCEYAAQASLLLDLKILLQTVPAVLLAKGAE